MGRLDGKVAVITGAASGIGRGTAIRFAGEGAAVVLADLNQDGGESAVRECKENGGRAVFQKTDVASGDDIKAAIDRAVREFGKLDIIFNNAGLGGAVGTIEEVSFENWDRTMAILLRAVFAGMKYAVPEMRKVGGGSIISTASVAGLRGGAGPHAYSAAKAAVINLTRSVALEVGKDRIRVNCICPGGINTPAHQWPRAWWRSGRRAVPGPNPGDTARGASRRYREHGAVPRQRRIGMGYGHGDGRRWGTDRGRRAFRPRSPGAAANSRKFCGTVLSDTRAKVNPSTDYAD